eukprot:TRINITY_DN15446_c0_g1_i1.p3 TRINITY_DN15446_c0_g1~~TRINITY_DN15446_c0_g1_i1.p3  ORF type:complete len:127 (+),score=21.67 TRINITY_DN15446_c0_g1_i1:312-692(+)
MSWQTYVDSNLVGSQALKRAAIFGHDAGQWATSSGLTIQPAEVQKLVAAFKDPSGIRAAGIYLAGDKYFALKADDRSIYGKKGAAGCVCVKTGKAVLIGLYDESQQPGAAANVVEKVADYLIQSGY